MDDMIIVGASGGIGSYLASVFEGEFDLYRTYYRTQIRGVGNVAQMNVLNPQRVREFADESSALTGGIDLLMTAEHSVNTRTTSINRNNKEFTFHFAEWVLSIRTMDPESKEVIDTLVMKDSTNGSYEDQALDRMLTKMLSAQVPAVSNWVYESIFKPEDM